MKHGRFVSVHWKSMQLKKLKIQKQRNRKSEFGFQRLRVLEYDWVNDDRIKILNYPFTHEAENSTIVSLILL